MTDALAALGVLAVVSTASLSPWTNILLVVGLALAIAVPESWQGRPALRHFATIAPLTLLILQGARLLSGRSPLDVAVEFAALLQIVRLATRRGAAHDQQIIVLALLHFVAGTVLGGGLTYGICFLGFLAPACPSTCPASCAAAAWSAAASWARPACSRCPSSCSRRRCSSCSRASACRCSCSTTRAPGA
jgi:hypothetical protein